MKSEENKTDTPRFSIARLVKERMEKHKRQLSAFLTDQSERLSTPTRKFVFLFIGIVISIAILLISYNAVHYATSFPFFNRERVLPLQPDPPDTEEIVTPEEYQVIIDFRKTLDSLRQSDPFAYRKLMRAHPGLLDSMSLLIHIYHSTH